MRSYALGALEFAGLFLDLAGILCFHSKLQVKSLPIPVIKWRVEGECKLRIVTRVFLCRRDRFPNVIFLTSEETGDIRQTR